MRVTNDALPAPFHRYRADVTALRFKCRQRPRYRYTAVAIYGDDSRIRTGCERNFYAINPVGNALPGCFEERLLARPGVEEAFGFLIGTKSAKNCNLVRVEEAFGQLLARGHFPSEFHIHADFRTVRYRDQRQRTRVGQVEKQGRSAGIRKGGLAEWTESK